ncbi:MAG TPA: right-handed parallel beta-helix repeat-containing protein [bacterium]|nr:right-handed parallel beta-helix repeat-containing protein [bacterium]
MNRAASGAIAIVILCACCAPADTWTIDASGGGDFTTIQEGITAAIYGDTVLVMPGTYAGPGNREIDFNGKNILVQSSGGPEVTVIDCESQTRGVYIHSGELLNATIDGFTITNGRAYEGAGIYVSSSSAFTIRQCVIEGCSTTFNSYAGGAGIYADANSIVHMYDCTVSNNLTGAYGGGASFTGGSQAVIEDCTFTDNFSSYNGGGIQVISGADADVSGTLFLANGAGNYGGGMHIQLASASIEDCTFYANSAASFGGGICCAQADPTITRCIISHSTDGEGIGCTAFPGPTDPQISNCNIFGNAGGDALCGTFWDSFSVDPLYCDAASGDLSLCADSPCLAGNNSWSVMMGSHGQGCGECGTGLAGRDVSWGVVKNLYR